MVNIVGVVINVIMFITIITLIIITVISNNQLNDCITKESPMCYTITCPCDDVVRDSDPTKQKGGPCFGNAKKSVGQNRWVCSNHPLTIVDDAGTIIKK